jgi:hypothetical protein
MHRMPAGGDDIAKAARMFNRDMLKYQDLHERIKIAII